MKTIEIEGIEYQEVPCEDKVFVSLDKNKCVYYLGKWYEPFLRKVPIEFETGRWYTITEEPVLWNSRFSNKNPKTCEEIQFPFTGELYMKDDFLMGVNIGGYGWSLGCLQTQDLIFDATEEEIITAQDRIIDLCLSNMKESITSITYEKNASGLDNPELSESLRVYIAIRNHLFYGDGFPIIAIERENQKFQLGDRVLNFSGKGTGRISEFKFIDQNLYAEIGCEHPVKVTELTMAQTYFTFDNVEVVMGELIYFINKENKIGVTPFHPSGPIPVFKTLDAAGVYVLENKPCLSIKDIQDIYVSARPGYKKNGTGMEYYEKLIKLVKQKNEND